MISVDLLGSCLEGSRPPVKDHRSVSVPKPQPQVQQPVLEKRSKQQPAKIKSATSDDKPPSKQAEKSPQKHAEKSLQKPSEKSTFSPSKQPISSLHSSHRSLASNALPRNSRELELDAEKRRHRALQRSKSLSLNPKDVKRRSSNQSSKELTPIEKRKGRDESLPNLNRNRQREMLASLEAEKNSLKYRQRLEIYALNKEMRDLENSLFEQFMAQRNTASASDNPDIEGRV